MATKILQPKRGFAVTDAKGNPQVFKGGETFSSDSPRLQGLSASQITECFEEWQPDHGVERATAAPGEKRTTPAKKKSG